MPIKMSGADYKALLASDWGSEHDHWDDVEMKVNGVLVTDTLGAASADLHEVEDGDIVEIIGGMVIHDQNGKTEDAVSFARKWLKARTHATLVVSVPMDSVAAFKAHVKSFKGAKVEVS